MKKVRLFAFIFSLLGLFIGAVTMSFVTETVSASSIKDTNIVYELVDKQINISDKKVCDITETLVIRYKESGINLGITRNISRTNKITRIVNGKRYVTTTQNKFKLNYVTVDGEPEYHFTETDSEYFYIMTGADNDFKSAGTYEYKINYTYDMGEDFIKDFDDFTFDLLDYDFGSPVMKFSASITLPTEFVTEGTPASKILTFRTNKMSALGFEALNAQVNGRTITCHYDHAVNAGTGFTMQLILPNKYFNTNYKPSPFYYSIPAVCIISGIGIAILIIFSLIRKFGIRNTIITPEFYPPKGYSPLDVARTYRGFVSPKDFASLILDWAAKGLVSLDVRGKDEAIITKLKDFPEPDKNAVNFTAQRLERNYFNSLFKKDNVYSTKQKGNKTEISTAVTSIYDFDEDVKKPTKIARTIGHILAMLPWIFYILWYGLNVNTFGFIMLFISLFVTVGTFVFLYASMPILFKLIWCGGFTGIPIAMLCIMGFQSIYDINGYATIAFVLFFVYHFLSRLIKIRSTKYDDKRGQVLGFKDFLVKAELDKLEMLIAEDPEYYYNILPYCYVFGITKKMEQKFKALRVDVPQYCNNAESATIFVSCLSHAMIHSSAFRSTHSSGMRGGFGGGGGGGGGSSGGGGGGGGSHGR